MLAPAWLIFTLKASPEEPNRDSLFWDPDAVSGADSGALAMGAGLAALGVVELVWEPLPTTEDTVWDTRGPIWARIWATRSEEEEDDEEPGRRIRRESWSAETEDEDCPVVDVEDWPATAEDTVWDTRGWIWEMIWETRDDWSNEFDEEVEDVPEDWLEDPDDWLEDPEERLEDPERRLDDPDEMLVEERPEDPDEEKPDPPLTRPCDPEDEEDVEAETGLGLRVTKPGCSVLSSVYPIAPAVYFTVIRDPWALADKKDQTSRSLTRGST